MEAARDDVVVRRVEIEAEADDVWRSLATDEDRAEWMGGDTALDLRPGGCGFVTDERGTRREVLVHDVEPGRRLSFDWWSEDDEPSHVQFTLQPTEVGTEVTVTERPLVPRARLSGAGAAMQASLALRVAGRVLV